MSFAYLRVPIPFGAMRADELEAAFDTSLREAEVAVANIQPSKATYDETLGVLDRATRDLDYAYYLIEHLDEVLGGDAYRCVYESVVNKRNAFYGSLPFSSALSQSISAFAGSKEAAHLDVARARFLRRTQDEFLREGATLDPSAKARLVEVDRRLAELTLHFVKNMNDAVDHYGFVVNDASRLAGLPDHALSAAIANAREHGTPGYRLTLQAPSLSAVLKFAHDRDLRSTLYLAHVTAAARNPYDNRPLVSEILALRAERAELLGFVNFVDYVTGNRMMGSGSRARAFVDTLADSLRPTFLQETRSLVAFASEHGHQGALQAWDVAYWAERQRRAMCDFNGEELRPYFALPHVLESLFDIAGKMFQVRITQVAHPVWHPHVTAWEVHDASSRIGIFYLDLFTRSAKREGAWMTPLLEHLPTAPSFPGLAIVAADIAPPSSDGEPALLSHDEVVRLFHEMGHLFHHILSDVPVRRLSGTRVAWDFVELPSTLFEHLPWQPHVLDSMMRHFKTNERAPSAMRERLIATRRFRAASALMRDVGLASLDLHLHSDYASSRDGDVVACAHAHTNQFSPVALPEEYAQVAMFEHVFGSTHGYEAGFYAYVWADVLAADVFEALNVGGSLSRGSALRETIFSRGDSADALTLFREFVGRDPDVSSLLKQLDIQASEGRPASRHV